MKDSKKLTTWEEWLKEREAKVNEVGTSTADVALFQQPTISVRRGWFGAEDDFFSKKKKRKDS